MISQLSTQAMNNRWLEHLIPASPESLLVTFVKVIAAVLNASFLFFYRFVFTAL